MRSLQCFRQVGSITPDLPTKYLHYVVLVIACDVLDGEDGCGDVEIVYLIQLLIWGCSVRVCLVNTAGMLFTVPGPPRNFDPEKIHILHSYIHMIIICDAWKMVTRKT